MFDEPFYKIETGCWSGSRPCTWQIFSHISSQPFLSWNEIAKSQVSDSDQTINVSWISKN